MASKVVNTGDKLGHVFIILGCSLFHFTQHINGKKITKTNSGVHA